MAYQDLNVVHNPATGTVAPAAWGDQVRDNFEFLIDPPACSVSAGGSQSIPDTTQTALTADTEDFDNDSMHSTVTNTSRITIQTSGRYLFTAQVNFSGASATGLRRVQVRVDGTTTHTLVTTSAAPVTVATTISGTKTLVLTAGQYVEVTVQQTSGGSLGATLTEFFAMFVTR